MRGLRYVPTALIEATSPEKARKSSLRGRSSPLRGRIQLLRPRLGARRGSGSPLEASRGPSAAAQELFWRSQTLGNTWKTTVFTTFHNIRANLCFLKHVALLGRSRQLLGVILASLGGHLGDFDHLFGCSRSPSRAILAFLGASRGPPRAFLAPPWTASG